METVKWVGWPIAFVLGIMLMFMSKCGHVIQKPLPAVHDTVTIPGDKQLVKVQDTVLQPFATFQPVYLERHDTILRIDTVVVVRDYFTPKLYRDTINKDQVLAVISDSVYRNQITWRDVQLQNKRPVQVVQSPAKEAAKLYAGFRIGVGTPLKPIAEANLIYIAPNEKMYQIGYDPINKSYLAGMAWKIHF